MGWIQILSASRHHGESADPALLEWIKGTLDHMLNLGPWTVVVFLGLFIALLPLGLVGFYLWQQRRTDLDQREPTP
ncbi:MAG: hypothetical protein ACE5Q6_08105 [Dehalococcoidia bacterium]